MLSIKKKKMQYEDIENQNRTQLGQCNIYRR